MTDQDLTQEVIDKMDEWAKRIAKKLFEKECEHIPPAVVCMAAVYLIVDQVKKSTVVTPAAILKILEGKMEEQNLGGFRALFPKESN
jgi:transcriptional regulator of met regulon